MIVTLLSFSEYKFNTNRLFQFLMPWHQLKFIFNLSLSMKASIFSMCLPHETRVDNPLHISCLIGNREEVESTLRQLHHWLCSIEIYWTSDSIISLSITIFLTGFCQRKCIFLWLVRFSQFWRWQLLSRVLQGSHKNDWKYFF